jgi:hypothetical protein
VYLPSKHEALNSNPRTKKNLERTIVIVYEIQGKYSKAAGSGLLENHLMGNR